MKYAIIDMTIGDWFESVYNTKEEAIKAADREWDGMTDFDKKRRDRFFVAACELDEDGCANYEELDLVKEYT